MDRRNSINEILLRLYPKFRGIATCIAGSPDDNLIDDVTQEMSAAILGMPKSREDTWYLQGARWAARDYLRKQRQLEHNQRLAHDQDSRLDACAGVDAEISEVYDQDADLLAANLGWD